MKPLLYTFILFVLGFPLTGYSQRKGKGNPSNNPNLRRHLERKSVPQTTKNTPGSQTQEPWQNRKTPQTLQEAQNQLNNSERPNIESLTRIEQVQTRESFTEIKQVQSCVKAQTSAFTFSEIRILLSLLDISDSSIFRILNKMTSTGELVLLQQGGVSDQPNTWIRKDILNKERWTPEEALNRYYSVSSKFSTKREQILLLIEYLESTFVISDIQRHFPYFSIKLIRAVLKELLSMGELVLVQGSYNGDVLVRKDILNKKGWTHEEALVNYYKNLPENLTNGTNSAGSTIHSNFRIRFFYSIY